MENLQAFNCLIVLAREQAKKNHSYLIVKNLSNFLSNFLYILKISPTLAKVNIRELTTRERIIFLRNCYYIFL